MENKQLQTPRSDDLGIHKQRKAIDKRILVVDDDQQMQSLLQDLFEDVAYKVDTASDGEYALELLARQPSYGAILLDLHMPRMDGLQFLQALQQDQEAPLSSIIAYSGDRHAIQQAVGMGIRCVLTKPFDLEHVLSLVLTSH